MKISFEKKLNLFFLIMCSAIITVGIISYYRNQSAVAADKWVKHTTNVIEILDKLLLSNIDIVTYTKEYLVHYDSISIPLLENSKKSASPHRSPLCLTNPVPPGSPDPRSSGMRSTGE